MKDRAENIRKVIEYLMADCHVCHQMPSSLEERQRMMRALMNVWEPRDISPEFLAMQDAELQMQREDKGVVSLDEIRKGNLLSLVKIRHFLSFHCFLSAFYCKFAPFCG